MAKYLDDTGLATLWAKIKQRDSNTLTAANNYTDGEIDTLSGTLTTSINGVSGRVTTLEGYFTNGKANEAVKATQDGDGAIISSTYIKLTQKGANNGVATLDSTGKIPSSQLPSFVDDVVEGYYHNGKFYTTSSHTTEITGEGGKIYVDLTANAGLKTYRWSGSAFVVISETITIGTTSGTAYDGALGAAIRTDLDSHTGNTSNPHGVTKAQVGLGSVVNTGDSATPVQNGTTKFTTGGAYTLQQSIPTTFIKALSQSGNTLNITSLLNGTEMATSYTPSFSDTGATGVEEGNSPSGANAVTSMSYSASTRKITYYKGVFLTPSDVEAITSAELDDILV